MMKTGRNDPCPCGSGRKFKKCCLLVAEPISMTPAKSLSIPHSEPELVELADEEFREPAPEPVPKPPRAAKPADPRMDAINARWLEFEDASDADRRGIFLKTLDEPELMDDDQAFEMLSLIHESAVESGTRDEIEKLIDQLEQRLPDVYATSRKYYLDWRIESALVGGRTEDVTHLARELAETAGEDCDQFQRTMNRLAYHGQLEALSQASRIAWPLIKDSDNILWGEDEFARWGADCVLFERLEQSPEIDGRDPELIEQIRYYFQNLEAEPFTQYVSRLGGQLQGTWSLKDFKRLDQTNPADCQNPFSCLLTEFVAYAHRQEGIPYTKAALAGNNIRNYLSARQAGKLKPKPNFAQIDLKTPRDARPKPSSPEHVLCPDRDTLDRYLGSMLGMFDGRYYDVAAMFELLPAWLRFLESRKLLEPAIRESTLSKLGDLQATLLKLWNTLHSDPTLAENFRRWPESAKLEPMTSLSS